MGPKRSAIFEKIGIRSIRDLFYYFPRNYEDRSNIKKIKDLVIDEYASVLVKVVSVQLKRIKRMTMLEVMVSDDYGILTAVWFNQPFLAKQFSVDDMLFLYGKVEWYKKRLQISSPEYEKVDSKNPHPMIHTGALIPIYPLTAGLFQKSLRTTFSLLVENRLEEIHEYLSDRFLKQFKLIKLPEAVKEMHFPKDVESLALARRRIVFDEFFLFEITLLKKLEKMRTKLKASKIALNKALLTEFRKNLPFELTSCQCACIDEITHEMNSNIPMNKLLMGDVGTGKTLVAAYSAIATYKSGYQAAFLVPTTVLANQHYESLRKIFSVFGIGIKKLTSSTNKKERSKILAELKQGKIDCLLGTHSILQDAVEFKKLGLVIVDEQHKFGVYQRNRLLNSKIRPHQLVMTATPIPRTLALTAYADLSVSSMREKPKNRAQIKTYWINRTKQTEVYLHMVSKLKKGEQAYIIFPLVEETENLDLKSAKESYERLKKGVFKEFKVGLVHGKMKDEERDITMQRFKEGEVDVLVSTSVIEVGIDNPNATMMLIEHAERFGLSQLHQFRGRIGRGRIDSECYLFGEPKSDSGKKRLRIMTKTEDGFVIAEEDLKIRGPGDFWGSRQSGEPLFQVANPLLDEDLFMMARRAALDFLAPENHWDKQERENVLKHLEQNPINY